jgi:uncharacterized protein YndB with AHSA1/START domain
MVSLLSLTPRTLYATGVPSVFLQTLELEDLGAQTKLTQTMRFETTEQRDTTMQYGVEEGAKAGFARVDALLEKIAV